MIKAWEWWWFERCYSLRTSVSEFGDPCISDMGGCLICTVCTMWCWLQYGCALDCWSWRSERIQATHALTFWHQSWRGQERAYLNRCLPSAVTMSETDNCREHKLDLTEKVATRLYVGQRPDLNGIRPPRIPRNLIFLGEGGLANEYTRRISVTRWIKTRGVVRKLQNLAGNNFKRIWN